MFTKRNTPVLHDERWDEPARANWHEIGTNILISIIIVVGISSTLVLKNSDIPKQTIEQLKRT